jgi:two-component system sensor kinase FixL
LDQVSANALTESNAITALQIDAVSDLEEIGFFSWDCASGKLTLSDRAATILDRPAQPSCAIDIATIRRFPIARRAQHIRAIRRALDDGDPQIPLSFVLTRRDGDRRHIRASIRPLWRDGRVEQLAGALTDQTDQRRSEAELRATMSTVPNAMIVIDGSGTIRAFSAAAELMFGRAASEAIGSPIEILMPEPYRSEHAGSAALSDHARGGPFDRRRPRHRTPARGHIRRADRKLQSRRHEEIRARL